MGATVLETPRLLLRAFTPTDEPALLAQWNDPEVRRYLFDGQPVPAEMVRAQVQGSLRSFEEHGFGFFTIALRDRPAEVIGFAGLRTFGEAGRVEVLYALLPPWWGSGLATEAARAVLADGFAGGLEEIWAGADPPNTASFRVMERLGMRFVEELVLGGRPARYYRITSAEVVTTT
jgi:ribosomal-protein-alanine N-acetyltransferase